MGETFHVALQLTANPGIVAYQVRLHWDEPLLDINARTAMDNALLATSFGADLQRLGPADNDAGSDAFLELGFAPYQAPSQSSAFVGPVAQFEFTCQAKGLANLTLADGHSLLADVPATEYTPTLTNAQILCVAPDSPIDTDQDGCADGEELAPKSAKSLGGGRDPLYFGDFMDQWVGAPPARDGAVTVGDIGAVVDRFGTASNPALSKEAALANALTQPADTTSYHASSDRGGSDPEGNLWNLLPPDGSITVGDIGAVVDQFGHSCAALP